MALSRYFVRWILGGGIVSTRSLQSRKSFMRLKSTLVSPRLFISGLSGSTTDEKLKEAFAPFGKIIEAKVILDKKYGISKGFGIVTYDTIEEAKKAREVMDTNLLEDCTISVEPRECEPSQEEQAPSDTGHIRNKTIRYIKREHYHTQAEAGEEYMNKDKVEKQIIRKGDIISLNDLLFTRNRDYLIKNDKEHVKAEQLKNKVIGIYFLPLYVECPQYSKDYTALLKGLYDDLQPFHNFEVILVAITDIGTRLKSTLPAHPSLTKDPQEHFEDLFSCMPWTAIPFSDVASRESMQRSFGVQEEYPTIVVVESTGMVLQCDTWHIFQNFGALGYPFSDERINFIREEDDAAANQPSLKTLLASPQRNYVISSKGDEVPIHTFEDKVVALYFYHVDVANNFLTKKLKFAYEELAKINKKFEVVLIYSTESHLYGRRSYCKESFCKEFETMPWLALPFGDECCKKLRRVFKISDNGLDDPNKLVIIGPHAEFIEPSGASILLQYSIPAYPFTFKKAVELEIEKIKELKLEMLWDTNTVFIRNIGFKVNFSELSGKRVMLVFERFGVEHDFDQNSPNTKFLMMLKGWYRQTKGTDDEFEVVRIVINNLESSTGEQLDLGDKCCLVSLLRNLGNLGDADWIVSLGSQLKHNLGSSDIWYGRSIDEFEYFLPILAFDRDGRLVRKTIYPTFEDMKFPFYAGDLEEEMMSQLTTLLR